MGFYVVNNVKHDHFNNKKVTEFSKEIETIKSWQNANFSLFEDEIFAILTHLPMVDFLYFVQ